MKYNEFQCQIQSGMNDLVVMSELKERIMTTYFNYSVLEIKGWLVRLMDTTYKNGISEIVGKIPIYFGVKIKTAKFILSFFEKRRQQLPEAIKSEPRTSFVCFTYCCRNSAF